MPVHDGERFLCEAVDSVLAQTMTDFALLVVDDGSADGTADLLARYADPRIRVLRNHDRLGPAASRNRAIDASVSKYVAFVDSDDVAEPEWLGATIAFLEGHPRTRLACARVAVIDEDGRRTGAVSGYDGDPEDLHPAMLFSNRLVTTTTVVDRALIGDERFDPALPVASDYDMWVRLLDRGRGACLPDVLARYRAHASNITHARKAETEACLREIATRRLRRLGVRPRAHELDVHYRLGVREPEGSCSFVQAAGAWLQTIESANGTSRTYDAAPLARVLVSQWIVACEAAARDGCWSAWPSILHCRYSAGLLKQPGTRWRAARLPWQTMKGSLRRRWPKRTGPVTH